MRVSFMLLAGDSATALDLGEINTKGAIFIYRFCVERFANADLKILCDKQTPRLISADSKTRTLDIATSTSIYIETVGKGSVHGWYEYVGRG
jgi:hypothetical protein